MIIEYEFKLYPIGYDAKHDEEYYETETFEYELTFDDMFNVARQMVMTDTGLSPENATKVVQNILWECDLLEQYLETDVDYVKEKLKTKVTNIFWSLQEN